MVLDFSKEPAKKELKGTIKFRNETIDWVKLRELVDRDRQLEEDKKIYKTF